MAKLLYSGYLKVYEDDGYEYVSEKDMVWIIPILRVKKKMFLGLRQEIVPPYGDGKFITIMSGTRDKIGEDIEETALRELKEEAGIIPKKFKIKKVFDDIHLCKTTNAKISVYFMDIKHFDKEEPKGDGSKFENESKTTWYYVHDLDELLKDNTDRFDMTALFAVYFVKNMLTRMRKKILVEAIVNVKRKYVIHEHQAKRAGLHYDLRIENDKHQLSSWAIRKGLPKKSGVKHLAIQQPNHQMRWLDVTGEYKGENARNRYGEGTYKILSKGTLTIINKSKDNLVFEISDGEFKGKYVLHRLHGSQWIIFKTKK